MSEETEKIDTVNEDETDEKTDPEKGVENGDGDNGEDGEAPPTEGDIQKEVENLKAELEKIKVEQPKEILPEEKFDLEEFDQSYRENLPKEKLVLAYAENFRRQYVHLYRDRKPLLLNPVNECGVEKFVSTTIRPTQLQFPEVYDWDGASEFVADYLNFEPLNPPTDLPKRLLSSTTVLNRQKGNCFEYSTLLCSLLIGNGYDAYVVSGYATKETCLMDETREICPLLQKKEETVKEAAKKEVKKYTVKPPKDLTSKFEKMMASRKVAEREAEEAKRRKEEEEKIAEAEKPPPDPLFGLRIHSWVLVLQGKREVAESFFIEPLTGLSVPLDTHQYLGIESLWNHQNYWVNMQDCSDGVKGMKYDLGDCTLWEFMFQSNEKPLLEIPEFHDHDDDDEEEEEDETEKQLDMPPSWVKAINITLRDFQMRCPQGKKIKLYKKSKLEKFAHYLQKDGLTAKLSVYDDNELKDLVQVKEFFNHRLDKLYMRGYNHRTDWVIEHYYPGRQRCLKEHTYKRSASGPENERIMVFYHEARVDGLLKREETPVEMTEHFKNRDDFLYYRHILFGKRAKKFGPSEGPNHRPIWKIHEKFHRNKDIPANEDIADLVFSIQEEKILLTYHTEDVRVSASTREFIKPPNADEKGATLLMTPDMQTTFQVDPNQSSKKQVELYQMLVDLVRREEKSRNKVRDSEQEVRDILNDRMKEEVASELEISVYDTERNEKAKKHRKELERLQLEEKMRRQDMEIDYLAPFIAQLGDPEKINKETAFRLKEAALTDLKKRLIDKANLIQARFEKETEALQKKQLWFQQHQVNMSPEDEEDYMSYCSEMMFRLNIFEARLNRHRELAPQKYMALEQRIRQDSRLAEFFMNP